MAEALNTPIDEVAIAEAELRRRRRGISPIWAVPIVAAVVAAWLGYTAFTEKGPAIAITFNTASGIEVGKTRIKHNDIELGVIEHVDPSADLSRVVVTARMNKTAADHLREGTNFWVVRPRIGFSGFSGLETLVSGAYIEMDPGDGRATHSFTGLEQPPVVRADVPGTEFAVTTDKLGALDIGSLVLFRGVQVGEVTRQSFEGIDKGFTVRFFVREPFDKLIYEDTRFWNASGISLTTGAAGFKVEVDSVQALLAGGIEFDTPEFARKGEPSKEGSVFPLYDGRQQARDASYTRAVRAIVEFDGSVAGLDIGTPVVFRGVKIGRVTDFRLEYDPPSQKLLIPVEISLEVERIRLSQGSYDQVTQGALLPMFVARGLRAQLRSASLITGQQEIAFDFFPNAPPATIVPTKTYPKLPTVPNQLESMSRSVSHVLESVAALPLDALVQDVRKILQSVLGLTDSPELRDSLKMMNKTMVAAESLLRDANGQVGPLVVALRKMSDSADITLKQVDATLTSVNAGYGQNSRVRTDLSDLLRQLQETARSIRMLASYLEQHPEALVRGKATQQ